MDVCAILPQFRFESPEGETRRRTSTSFLLRASLALSSMGVNPASFAHRCALVVLPMPGGPVIITPRKMFIPFFPGFLKLAFKLSDLETSSADFAIQEGRKQKSPVSQPLLEFLDLPLVTANLFECLRGIPIGPELRLRVYRLCPAAVSASYLSCPRKAFLRTLV